jgi:hypothetical protein
VAKADEVCNGYNQMQRRAMTQGGRMERERENGRWARGKSGIRRAKLFFSNENFGAANCGSFPGQNAVEAIGNSRNTRLTLRYGGVAGGGRQGEGGHG